MNAIKFEAFRQRGGSKAVAVAAVQFTSKNRADLIKEVSVISGAIGEHELASCCLIVATPDLCYQIAYDDWIVSGMFGYYVYKPSEFDQLFKPVES